MAENKVEIEDLGDGLFRQGGDIYTVITRLFQLKEKTMPIRVPAYLTLINTS